MHYRHLELDKISALRPNKGNFDSIIALSVQSNTELTWWVNNVLTASKPSAMATLISLLLLMSQMLAGELSVEIPPQGDSRVLRNKDNTQIFLN